MYLTGMSQLAKPLRIDRESCRGTSVMEARYTPEGLEVVAPFILLVLWRLIYFSSSRMTGYGASSQPKQTKSSPLGISPRWADFASTARTTVVADFIMLSFLSRWYWLCLVSI
jgi:hypothetical protein